MRNSFFNKFILIIVIAVITLSWSSKNKLEDSIISGGQQPQITIDTKGTIRVVYGNKENIYCATSNNGGITFSKPVLVANIPGMHLGMSRGPQLATSNTTSIITAIDKKGNIYCYQLIHSTNQWKKLGVINDIKESAPEGLMGLAADTKDNFYATWLDIRIGKRNQLFFSMLPNRTGSWSKNKLIYQSPDQHICECCKPSLAVKDAQVTVMFRNWLHGSRDLYLITSNNNGNTFNGLKKLGNDTWKLNGCPMDGGGLVINNDNLVKTVWQRKGSVYYCEPDKAEKLVDRGRLCNISNNGSQSLITYQTGDSLKVKQLENKPVIFIGKGSFLKASFTDNKKIFCVWEQDDLIKYKLI